MKASHALFETFSSLAQGPAVWTWSQGDPIHMEDTEEAREEPEDVGAADEPSEVNVADRKLLCALFKTVHKRYLAARASMAASSMKLQTLQRGRVAKVEMMKMREAAKCFETVAPVLKSLVLRIRLASFEERSAVLRLQQAGRAAVARRRVHTLCVQRLQARDAAFNSLCTCIHEWCRHCIDTQPRFSSNCRP